MKTFTARIFLMLTLLFLNLQLLAQLRDDFSDGDFTINPAWIGTAEKFAVTDGMLKLQAPALAESAYLVTESQLAVGVSWEFFVRMDFNPSGTNYTRIYLTSDNANLEGPLNGYYVMIGNTADEVSLYRQSGNTRTKIIDGEDGRLNRSRVVLKVSVTRDATGHWELFSDVDVTGQYVREGGMQDATHQTSSYFGLFCKYTATRADRFSFDDFTIEAIEDNYPPMIQSVEVLSVRELEVVFSKRVNPATVTANHFIASHSIGKPITVALQEDQRTVTLTFDHDFLNGITAALTVEGVEDISGNVMSATEKEFLFFIPSATKKKDVIVTEIFADPSPRIELPESEFVELFNRTGNPVSLAGWTLTDGSSTATLPYFILLPRHYVIITPSNRASEFLHYGEVMGVANFPTLNNPGDNVILKNENGITIDSVRYADSWYRDSKKKEGGWTLELIDPENLCAEKDNWTASEDENGGTPGRQNSVYANKPDLTGPKLIAAHPISDHVVRLFFNEKLEHIIPDKNVFSFLPELAVQHVEFAGLSLTQIDVVLKESLQQRMAYTVTAKNIFDCSGNRIQSDFNKAVFAVPEQAASLDILVNEILFNPSSTGVDFVEVVNVSEKFIDLKNWSIANFTDGEIKNARVLSVDNFLFKPGSYLVFTKDGNVLKGEYLQAGEENFFEVSLPAFNNDKGSVALIDQEGNIIDYFEYTKDMHSPFIKDVKGVSLERISFHASAHEPSNWKSASSTVGFATPGYLNSNSRAEGAIDEHAVVIDPEAFRPISGQPDFTQIKYRFEKGGYIANVKIYDAGGQVIKQLAHNALLGAEGSLRWDGDRDDGSKARVGYYMIWFEVFDEKGTVKTFRKRVAVAGRF